jgi:D-aspartate ligase
MRVYVNPVVVLGEGLTALRTVRTFGKRGIDAYLVLEGRDVAHYSKYCKKSFSARGMRRNQNILKTLLKKIAKRCSKRVVVYPTSDLDAVNLADLKEDMPDDYCFVVGEKEPVRTLVDKSRFYKALAQHGIDHPKTYFPETAKDTQKIAGDVKYPIFIRPAVTQLFSQVFDSNSKGFIAYSPRELLKFYSLSKEHGIEMMIQEIIPGPPTNSYQLEGYYNTDHNPTVLFARQRLRIWPPDFGNTTLCVSIPMAELEDEKNSINFFMEKIGYHGLGSAEFKKDDRDGALKLLEINARPWWHFWLSGECGPDIVFLSYLDAIGEKNEYTEHYEIGVKSMHCVNDMVSAGKMFLNGSISLQEWAHSLKGIRQFAFLSADDSAPFFMELATRCSSLLGTISKKNS